MFVIMGADAFAERGRVEFNAPVNTNGSVYSQPRTLSLLRNPKSAV
jgi:hypothetical protein